MENWMQKFENKKEETYEEMIRNELDPLLDLVDHSNIYRVTDMEKALTRIVELYEKLEKSELEYDKKDMILKKKQLAELRFKIKKEEHMESHESKSWKEFEKEEQERDDDEER
jgi:predicted oxidoreductase